MIAQETGYVATRLPDEPRQGRGWIRPRRHVRNRLVPPGVRIGVDVETLRRFRAMKDDLFATDPSSPLTPRQRERFRGLVYYPPNPELVLEAGFERYVTPGCVDLVTSYGNTERYRLLGVAWFEVTGVSASLGIFRSSGGQLFLPFRDATSVTETYAAGRYLEARPLARGRILLLDFNYAYNPYCAYGPDWRCPLPPVENRLAVPIRAGERCYPDPESHAEPPSMGIGGPSNVRE